MGILNIVQALGADRAVAPYSRALNFLVRVAAGPIALRLALTSELIAPGAPHMCLSAITRRACALCIVHCAGRKAPSARLVHASASSSSWFYLITVGLLPMRWHAVHHTTSNEKRKTQGGREDRSKAGSI